MIKPMLKIYIVLAVSLALCVFFLPAVLGHTSVWASEASVHVRLIGQPDSPVSACAANEARIIFMMDDGWATQYTPGYDILEKYNYPGCVAVIPAAVGTENYITYSQLADLYIEGWDMLNHTYNHQTLTYLTPSEQKQQISSARNWLKSRGLSRGSDILVFPGGEFDDITLEVLIAEGFKAGRSLKSVWTVKSGCSQEKVEICNLVSGMSEDYVQRAIDKTISNDSALILVIHKIEPVTGDEHMQLPSEFITHIVDYVHGREYELNVVTMEQLLNSL